MLHLNGDSDPKKDVSSFVDLGSLNVRYLKEMCLDAKNTFISPRSLSPTSSDSSISHTFSSSPFFSSTPIPTGSICSMNMPKLGSHYSNYSQLASNEVSGIPNSPVLINVHTRQQQHQNTYKGNFNPQYNLHHIDVQQQQKNEISKSLKMFAMLAAYKYENDPIRQRVSPVDEIMQDFYCNGYVTDDSNVIQQRNCEMETALHKHCSVNNNDYSKNRSYNVNFNLSCGASSQSDANMVINNNENAVSSNPHYVNPNSNLWMFQLPSHSPYFGRGVASSTQQHAATVAAAAAATAAAFVNIDYNSTNIKKPQKRYGSTKFDKYSAVKHCVFCENNNEPEAVVKSHAVRDSLGRVLCPKLRTYVCPICKASGDEAHTVKYCPQKPIITMEDAVKAESLRLGKNSYFKQGMKV